MEFIVENVSVSSNSWENSKLDVDFKVTEDKSWGQQGSVVGVIVEVVVGVVVGVDVGVNVVVDVWLKVGVDVWVSVDVDVWLEVGVDVSSSING